MNEVICFSFEMDGERGKGGGYFCQDVLTGMIILDEFKSSVSSVLLRFSRGEKSNYFFFSIILTNANKTPKYLVIKTPFFPKYFWF